MMQESGTGTDGPSNPADRLTTDESQLAIDNSSAEYTAKDDKKSVLRKVKDKMKKLGNKLKPKSYGHEADDKQEIIDQSAGGEEGEEEEEEAEEEEEVSTVDKNLQTNPKDLDVPLDEYALLKQKEAENKGDEGSVQGRGLEDSLTDGLSSQSIAEQEPTVFRDLGPSGVLQAVPTNYHYKEGDVNDEDNKDQVGASEEVKVAPSQAVPTEDDNVKLEKDLPDEQESEAKLDQNAREEPVEGSGGDNETRHTPAASPTQVADIEDQGPGIFASKDGVTPNFTSEDIQALSKSNLYTGEPDVKSAEDKEAQKPESIERDTEVPKTADKASEAEAGTQKVGFGDNESLPETNNSELEKENESGYSKAEMPEAIEDEKSAGSKLEDESSANEGSYQPSGPASAENDRDIKTSDSGISNEDGDFDGKFVDAKPEMEPASRALETESSTNENAGSKFEEPPETLSNDNEQSSIERGDDKKDGKVSESLKEQNEPADDSGTQQMKTSGAAGSVASPDESRESKELDEVKDRNIESEPVEVKRDAEAKPVDEDPSKEGGTEDQEVARESGAQEMGKSGAAETVASPNESEESKELDGLKDMNIETEPVDVKERNTEADEPVEENPLKEEPVEENPSKEEPVEENPSKEAQPVEENPSKENEAPPTNVSESPGMAQKFMDSITSKFGFSSPRENEDTKAQQERFIDDKTTELLHGQAQ